MSAQTRSEEKSVSRKRYSITIEITVTDEQLLREQAISNAVQGGETPESAEERLQTVRDYIQQVFDPGVSPPGTEIEDSDVSVLDTGVLP
jgi:hypothetical protein